MRYCSSLNICMNSNEKQNVNFKRVGVKWVQIQSAWEWNLWEFQTRKSENFIGILFCRETPKPRPSSKLSITDKVEKFNKNAEMFKLYWTLL